MVDKQKIINMTEALEKFVRTHSNILIIPRKWSINLFPLLKRLNANIVGIVAEIPNAPEQNSITTPTGSYSLLNSKDILKNIDPQTGIIFSESSSDFISNFTFSIGAITISIPAFSLDDEEALMIYDRLTLISTLNRYKEDGVINYGIKDIATRFVHGMATFVDSRYQDLKATVWDRRELAIPIFQMDDTAIVMQGPILYKDNYTIITAQLYRQWYPNIPIIISTWQNEATNEFREICRKLSIVLLENEVPAESGALHVNYQIKSSFKGLEYVKENTLAKYALKCRTDQRLNRADFLVLLKNMLKLFPPTGDKLDSRIIVLGVTTKMNPFFVSDFLYFSKIENVKKIFDIKLQPAAEGQNFLRIEQRFHYINRKLWDLPFFSGVENKYLRKVRNFNIMMNKFDPPETFILKNFYNDHIETIEPQRLLQIYWKFLRDYLIIVDREMILWDWQKYPSHNGCYKPYYNRGVIDFAGWLNVYLNYQGYEG